MEYSNAKKTFFGAVLISVCIFSAVFSVSVFRYLKNTEAKFNKEKAGLIKESMDLQDKMDSIEDEIKQKNGAITNLETEKKTVVDRLQALGEEAKLLEERYAQMYNEKVNVLKKENKSLRGRMNAAKKLSIVEFLKDNIGREGNDNIKKVLQDALSKIELVKAGKSVSLEPIVVAEKGAMSEKEGNVSGSGPGESGKVLSIDTANNLVVIDIGRKDGAKEGQNCVIIKSGEEIATGEIISTRYKMSAAFVGEIKQKHVFSDIAEGDKVLVKG